MLVLLWELLCTVHQEERLHMTSRDTPLHSTPRGVDDVAGFKNLLLPLPRQFKECETMSGRAECHANTHPTIHLWATSLVGGLV